MMKNVFNILSSRRYKLIGKYKICSNCIMDTSALDIEFDTFGVCGFCRGVVGHIGKRWFPNEPQSQIAIRIFNEIRNDGLRQEYDSILGLSGGVDSAVVAIRAKQLGLRPLAVHVDGGWNTKESIRNIKSVSEGLGLDLKTIVIDWDEMKDLQIAYLRSGTLNQDIPQDHAFFVSLYKTALSLNITTILSGVNFATESVQPLSWGHSYIDGDNINAIYKHFFPKRNLENYPVWKLKDYELNSKKFKVFEPLNYGVYNPDIEVSKFVKYFDWHPYNDKHGESIFTKWFQSVFLYNRYNIDVRRAHLSCKIISGIINRESALQILELPPINSKDANDLSRVVSQKLSIKLDELESMLELPKRENKHYI
jgi:N-acetyl sugar amidotransferase